ncbi:melanocortin receptor 5-like [Thrips palmi]|uniref:Melanocortin receptor 5-like n=1 Tax=Thrips palmi TaxID=161013 RepID=A0A6P8Z7Z2_THRPL|nr:melanocortin receptor 5-like [Thrips palmi]
MQVDTMGGPRGGPRGMLPPIVVLHRNSSTWPTDSVCILDDPAFATSSALLRAVLSVQGITALTIMLVNAYTMAAIWPRRHRRSTQSTLFVLHLALADALVGVSMFVHIIFSTSCFMANLAATHESACLIPVVLGMFTWTLSATTLAAIAVDRYVCIMHSLRYYEFMNTRRVTTILCSLWVFSIFCACLYLPTWEWQEGRLCQEQNIVPVWHLVAVQMPLSVLVLGVVAVTHISIRQEARRSHARAKAAHGAPWLVQSHSSASIRSARIVILVVGGFIMGDLPMKVFQVLLIVEDGSDNCSYWAFVALQIFSSLWYLVNPFIYAWKNASIREDMTVLWTRLTARCKCSTVDQCMAGSRTPVGARRF